MGAVGVPHHVHLSHLNPPRRRRQHPAQHPNRGDFARAVRAQQTKNFTGMHCDMKVINRDEIAEPAGQVFGEDKGGEVGHSFDKEGVRAVDLTTYPLTLTLSP